VIATSKPIKDVANAYGVGPETLRNWLIKYREANGGTGQELTLTERARLKAVEREVQEFRAETAFLNSPRLLYLVPVLVCPVGMGLMMWFMMHGQNHSQDSTEQELELARLRAEVGALRSAPTPFEGRHPFRAPGENTRA
jgi:transposase